MATRGIYIRMSAEEYANIVQRTPRGKSVSWQARQMVLSAIGLPTDDAAAIDRAAYDHETE